MNARFPRSPREEIFINRCNIFFTRFQECLPLTTFRALASVRTLFLWYENEVTDRLMLISLLIREGRAC